MTAFIAYRRRLPQTFIRFDGSTPHGTFTRLQAGSFGIWNARSGQWCEVRVGDYVNVTDPADAYVVRAECFARFYEQERLVVSGGRGHVFDVTGHEVVGP